MADEVHVADADDAGERLDAVVSLAFGVSRSAAAKAIAEGRVRVDDVPQATKSRKVVPGETIELLALDVETLAAEAPDASYEVAHEDEHLLVVDKPAGVVVHPAPGHRFGTLAQALRGIAAGGEDPDRAGVVHRLDRDTSGLLVVARTEEAHAALKRMMQAREIRREYLALVEGRPPARAGTIDAPLGRDRRVRTKISTETDDPHEAVTHFEIAEALPTTTLLRVRLETGRTHQIRAHMLAIGHPVCGDPVYGRPAFGLPRQFLHAARLAFAHPVTGDPVDVTSPLPPELEEALAAARYPDRPQ